MSYRLHVRMSNSAGVRGVVLGLGRLCRPITAIGAPLIRPEYFPTDVITGVGTGGGGARGHVPPFSEGRGKDMFVPPPPTFRPRI